VPTRTRQLDDGLVVNDRRGAVLELDFDVGVVERPKLLGRLPHPRPDGLAVVGVYGAERTAEGGLLRDHVVRVAPGHLGDRENGRGAHVGHPIDKLVEVVHELGCHPHGVDALVGTGRVAGAFLPHPHVEPVGRGGGRARDEPVLADIEGRVHVNGVRGVEALHDAGPDHEGRAAGQALLVRLKKHAHPARERLPACIQNQRYPNGHGRVGVVPAEVSHVGGAGAVRRPLLVLRGKRINIGPVADRPAGFLALDIHVEPRARNGAVHVQPEALQRRPDEARRVVLVHAHLRVHVEVAADRHEQLGQGGAGPGGVGDRVGQGAGRRGRKFGRHAGEES